MKDFERFLTYLKQRPFDVDNMRYKLYELFTDPIDDYRKSLHDYLEKEPGYIEAWLNAYLYGLQSSCIRPTFEFIFNIHKKAVKHLPGRKSLAPISPQGVKFGFEWARKGERLLSRNVSKIGLEELFSYWLTEKKYLTQYIHISALGNADNFERIYPSWSIKNKRFEIIYSTTDMDAPEPSYSYSELILERLSCKERTYQVYLASSSVFWQQIQKASNCASLTFTEAMAENLRHEIERYNLSINTAQSLDDKLKAIVLLSMRVNQTHAFEDGNLRTAYILLNCLLSQNNLPFTILLDPSYLDCHSISICLEMVKTGMHRFLMLCRGEDPPFKLLDLSILPFYETHDDIKGAPAICTNNSDITNYIRAEDYEKFILCLQNTIHQIDILYFIENGFLQWLDKINNKEEDKVEEKEKLCRLKVQNLFDTKLEALFFTKQNTDKQSLFQKQIKNNNIKLYSNIDLSVGGSTNASHRRKLSLSPVRSLEKTQTFFKTNKTKPCFNLDLGLEISQVYKL